jgi:predicted DNA-binding transcriptional regulator YafY
MAAAAAQLARLLALVPWLQARPGVTKAEAAAAFGISVEQLDKDLQLVFTCELPGQPEVFIDIDYLDSDRITVLDPQVIGRPLRLRPDETVALVVGLRTLAATPGLADRDAVDSVLAKLEDLAGDLRLPSGEPPAASGGSAAEAVTAAVTRALSEHRRLQLRYWVPARDEVTQREVDPMRAVTVDGVGYLEGWCHSSEAVRTFRLDRVVAAEVLDTPSAPPPEAALPADSGTFHPSPDDAVVTLELAPPARWVSEYYPCESVQELPGGALRVVLRTADPRLVRRLVLRLGGAATVVSPVDLAEEVAADAAAALAAYGVSR